MAEDTKEKTDTPPPAGEAPAAAPNAATMDIPAPLGGKKSFLNKLMSPPLVFVVIAVISMASAGGTILFLGNKHHGDVADAGESLAGQAEAAEGKKEEKKAEEKKDAPAVSEEAKKAEGAQGTEALTDGVVLKMEPQVYNVMEKNSIHYLKLRMSVLVTNQEGADELKAKDEQVRDKILYLISDSSLRDLMSTGGKTLLKEDVMNAMNKIIKKGMVKQIYFIEFTIQ